MLHLMLAQIGSFSRQQRDPKPDEILAFVLIMGVVAVISLGIQALVCYILYSVQSRVPQPFRKMEPGLVWLMMVPLVSIVWSYFVYLRVPESLQAAFNAMGRYDVGDCGRSMGLTIAILSTVSLLGSCIPFVNCVTGIGGLVAVVLLIIFLVKLVGLKGQLPPEMPMGAMPAPGMMPGMMAGMPGMPGMPPGYGPTSGQPYPPYPHQPPPPPPPR